ncbi:dTDP-glucose 4,6-dehydratase [Tepidiforma sp.]|uniref:dTDP-glucose 4,6-dehydratase n=1 Tax=Tepidiforma sp. TaxID=2682230 RepID=UPI002ADDFEE7|nr:dTDP-glucose 4,6-dehydratase [Tepidiforma sp.]
MRALVTGGCGFIGSHVVRSLVADGWEVINLDRMTYAANPANVAEVVRHPRYRFVQGDICDGALVRELVGVADVVLNFAAETHVDRSLLDPGVFVRTDVEGVVMLLEALRERPGTALVHMSTDEVFGSIPAPLEAREDRAFAPSSPYAASKAAAELMIRAYAETYGMAVTVVRCCNVFGPRQHLEKFIPLFTMRALAGEPMPLYGDGMQEREWLYVDDLVEAVRLVLEGLPTVAGVRAVHVGSGERVANRATAEMICDLLGRPRELITPVADRPGHDRRYALDSSRMRELGWAPRRRFVEGLAETVRWYRDHGAAWARTAQGDFARYFERQYGERLGRR